MYDPVTGSFLQDDPAASASSYSFASGWPTVMSDPSGMFPWGKILVGVVLAAAVAGFIACAAATDGVCAAAAFAAGATECEEGGCDEAAVLLDDLGSASEGPVGDALSDTASVTAQIQGHVDTAVAEFESGQIVMSEEVGIDPPEHLSVVHPHQHLLLCFG